MTDIKIKLLCPNASPPAYATAGSAGMDLSAAVEAPLTIPAGEWRLVPCGVAVQIPPGFGGFVFARSGLAVKKGITLCNGVGVIDNDYTGEIKIAVINLSDQDYTINPGDRIAQLVILPVETADFVVVDDLSTTRRGSKGFGSTGK